MIPFPDLNTGTGVDDEMIQRIETYQRRVMLSDIPDGRVDPSGQTLAKLNANAKNLTISIPLFPMARQPNAPFDTGGRKFGALRSGGNRKHAACDLLAPVGTPIRAMEDGKVIAAARIFLQNTVALEVDHGCFIARYCEMSHAVPTLNRAGAAVKKGETVGFVGQLTNSSMLHLELYSGSEAGSLTNRNNPPFQRRADLLNPTDFLKAASMNVSDRPQPAPVPASDGTFGRVGSRDQTPLNLRSNSNTGSAVIDRLEPGTRFKILQRVTGGGYIPLGTTATRNDWLEIEVEVNGAKTTGFVAAFFVDTELLRGRVNSNIGNNHLNLRTHPQLATAIIESLSLDTDFVILEQVTGDEYDAQGAKHSEWFHIDHNGTQGFVAAFFVDIVDGSNAPDIPSPSGLNAILFTFEPKGASDRTANQDGLPAKGIHGVEASEVMAKTDQSRVMAHKSDFIKAAEATDLPPALLAAIASRESRGGAVLDARGRGDSGNAFGIMQIDFRFHRPEVEDGPAGFAHILQAAEILQEKLKGVQRQFESLTDSSDLQTAVSRYNGGSGHAAPNSDQGTTGGDYCNDVWARARFYARVENW